jgi:hemoglobin-like flavoprotein
MVKPPITKKRKPAQNGLFSAEKLYLLRSSFARIDAQSEIAGLMFYQKLFTLEPNLQPLFHTSIDLQTRKLMNSLHYIVATIENPTLLTPALEAMGRRHVAYGVRKPHYELAIRALLETFGQILGDGFSPDIHEVWREVLCFVAKSMKNHRN